MKITYSIRRLPNRPASRVRRYPWEVYDVATGRGVSRHSSARDALDWVLRAAGVRCTVSLDRRQGQ